MKKEGVYFPVMTKLGFVSLFGAIASAMVSTIWAIYIDSFVHSAAIVGFISGALALISFFSYFVFIPVLEKHNKSRLFFFSIFLFGLLYLLFAINKNFYVFIVLACVMNLIFVVRLTSFGIIVKDKSPKKKLSKNEGILYTFANLAWVIGPLIAGFLASRAGISSVFLLSAFFCFASFLLFRFSKVNDAHIVKKSHGNAFKSFIGFFESKDRVLSYLVSAGISFWWSLIYIFIPVYMVEQGLTDMLVAYFLFAIPIPLIFLEFKSGKLAGKIGFRKMFKFGFLFVAICCAACFFLIDVNIYLILVILVISSIGMAMLEPTSEAYFFDITKDKEEPRYYGPHKTSIDAGQFVAKILSGVILSFLAFKFLFVFFAVVMLIMFFVSFRIKNVVEAKKKC